jgi:peptidoglycan/xylan/chitin deacetylase (PgdA/CDA1 family)
MTKVYLTFDDGPRPGTDDVISVLESRRVPGTLFMVGGHASGQWRRDQLTAARSSKFVEVANHSMNHAGGQYRNYYGDPQGVLADFQSANATLELTGNPIPARFPGRNTWRLPTWSVIDPDNGQDSRAAAELLFGAGFRIYGWDVEWHMTPKGEPIDTPLWVYRKINFMRTFWLTEGLFEVVLLTHDVMFKDSTGGKAKLAQLIDMLQGAGYTFDFISNFRGQRPNFRRFPPR